MRHPLAHLSSALLLLAFSLSCGTSSQVVGSPDDPSTTTTAVSVVDPPIPPSLVVIDHPADSTSGGVRLIPRIQETPPETSDPCTQMGLFCLPFAPEGLSNCDEMAYYRIQFGLPDRFQSLGYRESNCRNEEGVRTYCCYGYWQMYFSQHYSDPQGRQIYEECQVDEVTDYNGDSPLDKQKQACTVQGLFKLMGYSPWQT